MADRLHHLFGPLQGVHGIHNWAVFDATERTGLTLTALDIGKVARQLDDGTYWLLRDWTDTEGGADWVDITQEQIAPPVASNATPTTAIAVAAAGSSLDFARGDHAHGPPPRAVPVAVGAANAEGVSTSYARADHVHDASSKADALFAIISDTNTSYTMLLANVGKLHILTNAAAIAVTVPTTSFPIGSVFAFMQGGAGQLTFTPAGGITLRNPGLSTKTRTTYSRVTLEKIASTEWLVSGDLATS